MVPKAAQNLIAGHTAAQLGTGDPTAGDDDPVAQKMFLFCAHIEAHFFFFDALHFAPAAQVQIAFFQREPQNVQHAGSLVGVGIVFPAGFANRKQTELLKKGDCLFRAKSSKGRLDKIRRFTVIMRQGSGGVG